MLFSLSINKKKIHIKPFINSPIQDIKFFNKKFLCFSNDTINIFYYLSTNKNIFQIFRKGLIKIPTNVLLLFIFLIN